ncbi:hypothetical protein [Streptomyces sp. NPDC059742]|uniref:hypothetical protein n=1 Tax=Streptomyces sp. NPDC059742 TaxID=3346927 RepID=UPI00365FFFC1
MRGRQRRTRRRRAGRDGGAACGLWADRAGRETVAVSLSLPAATVVLAGAWRAGTLLLELRPAQASLEGDGLSASDLVLAPDLEEAQVAQFPAVGLGQAGIKGLQQPDTGPFQPGLVPVDGPVPSLLRDRAARPQNFR